MRITISKIPRFLPKATVEGKAGLGILLFLLSDESRSISRVDVAPLALQILDQRLERGDAVDNYEMVALSSLSP